MQALTNTRAKFQKAEKGLAKGRVLITQEKTVEIVRMTLMLSGRAVISHQLNVKFTLKPSTRNPLIPPLKSGKLPHRLSLAASHFLKGE